jgi:6-pyruvoyltetrahydropterin/6-carboxytetrahydropterin synthase
MFLSTKEYGHEIGLSACFRQWKAESHCNQLHGYALAVKFTFGAVELDVRNWVVDFGSLKTLKGWLQDTFDHTLLVSEDDPKLQVMLDLDRVHKIAKVIPVPACGCEMFAEMIFECTEMWLRDNGYAPRVKLLCVEVKEHGANSAMKIAEGAPL